MKIKEGFMLRQMGDSYVAVALGEAAKEFRGIIRLNETGAFLFQQMSGQDRTREELLAALLAEYRVEEAKAAADLDAFLIAAQRVVEP